MADEEHAYPKGRRVEVRRFSGWRPGTVVGSSRGLTGGRARLFFVLVDGEQWEKPYRADQMRPLKAEPEPPPCARCELLKQENEGLKKQVRMVTDELRKWVDAG